MATCFGHKGQDMVEAMVLDEKGNVYLGGSFNSAFITFGADTFYNTTDSGGVNDVFLAKLSPEGAPIWASSWGGKASETIRDLAVDQAGNVYISGVFMSDTVHVGEYQLTKYDADPNLDLFVTKYSADGNMQWLISGGGEGNEGGTALHLGTDGHLVMAGNFQSNVLKIGEQSLVNHSTKGTSDIFIAVIDAQAGKVLSVEAYGGEFEEQVFDMALAPNGERYLTGYFDNIMKVGEHRAKAKGEEDMFLLKLDSAGRPQWLTGAGGGQVEYGSGVAYIPGSGIAVVGSMESEKVAFGDLLLKNPHTDTYFDMGWNYDLFVARYNDDGKALWVRQGHGMQQDHARGVAVNKWGDIYVAGFFVSDWLALGDDTLNNSAMLSNQEMMVVKYNGEGQYQWGLTGQCRGNEQATLITLDLEGRPHVAGSFAYKLVLGADTLEHKGMWDMYLARIVEQ